MYSISGMLRVFAASLLTGAGMVQAQPGRHGESGWDGIFYGGEGDREYLRLLDISRRMFAPDPEYQNLPMLYTPAWNGLVEGPTWGAWWVQNSYGTTYCALPFLTEPYLTFLQNAQDLWFDQMGDGQRTVRWQELEWTVPDGQLCDAAAPGWFMPKQGDGHVAIHDWGLEFTAAGLLMQAELLLISRDPETLGRYLPKLERCAAFLETRRDPETDLFLAGPAANLLAPSYAGWKRPDGTWGKAYLTGLSVTYIAALDRLIELEKLAGRRDQAETYREKRDSARRALPQLTTDEGYFIKSLDPDGTRHGVYGARQHGYFEAVCNHDAICFRVVDDEQAERIYAKIASIPGLRRHDLIITNEPGLDDMYVEPQDWLWQHGTWVNGGHWTTCEARMIMAYFRVGAFEDARRSMLRILDFARDFRLDNPLVDFGNAVYQPGEPVNLCYDSFGAPAAMVRGLFEYLYTAEGLRLVPHIPPSVTRLEQRFPVRLGHKRIYLSTVGSGPVTAVTVNGDAWPRFEPDSVSLPFADTPDRAVVQIVLGDASPASFAPRPRTAPALRPPTADDIARLVLEAPPPMTINDLPLHIGADSNGGSRFIGDLGRVSIYDRALTPGQIETLARDDDDTVPAPVARWGFGTDPGDDGFRSTAGQDLTAEVVGDLTVVDSPTGRSLRLDGRGFLRVPDSPVLDLDRACTIAARIRPGQLPQGGVRIVDKTTVGASDGYLLDTYPGNALRLICARTSLGADVRLEPGEWVHVAATIAADGSVALFLDGRCVARDQRSATVDIERVYREASRLHAFYEDLAAAGLGRTYEAAHARLAVECLTVVAQRRELLEAGVAATPLPPVAEQAAQKVYLDTVQNLCAGIANRIEAYAGTEDPQRAAIHRIWSERR